jgi:hypothetical protein
MFYEDAQAIVDRAAELMPEPPRSGDLDGCARWEDLVVATGRRLALVLDADAGLLRSLMGEERPIPAGCRQRRGLLLHVALCTTLGMRKAEFTASGVPCLQVVAGSVAARSVVEVPRPLTLRRGSPET